MRTPPPPGSPKTTDWIGKTVITREDISTSMMTIPAGTIMQVTDVQNGLTLNGISECICCGLQPRANRVPSSIVHVFDAEVTNHKMPIRMDIIAAQLYAIVDHTYNVFEPENQTELYHLLVKLARLAESGVPA